LALSDKITGTFLVQEEMMKIKRNLVLLVVESHWEETMPKAVSSMTLVQTFLDHRLVFSEHYTSGKTDSQ
jgi:hypothetical protein